MKPLLGFLSRHKTAVTILVLLVFGALLRWEVREVKDAANGQLVASYHGVVMPWRPCGASGGGRLVDFRVQHWLCYGLIKLEARGRTM
jgi:hypothetical protein